MKTPRVSIPFPPPRLTLPRGGTLIVLMIIVANMCIFGMMLTNLQHTAVCNMDYHEAEMRAQAQADNALELALAQLVAGSQPPDKFKVIVGKTNSGIAAVRRLSDETWEIAVVGKANIWEGSCPPLAPPTVCVRLNVRVRATYLKSERRLAILEYQRTSSRFEEPPEFTLASP